MENWTMGRIVKYFLLILVASAAFVFAANVGYRYYSVWSQRKAGEAKLAEAEQSRQIAVEEAKAKRAAAQELAQAEIERAKGVAEANRIIGESLRDNESYLRYLWVQGLQDGSSEVIYVPTESNLPILEAGRMEERKRRKAEH